MDHVQEILEDLEVVEDFVGEAEAAQIFDTIQSSKSKWEVLIDRETQQYGGVLTKSGMLLKTAFPSWLARIAQKISSETDIFRDSSPNHVLVNRYQVHGAISPHSDGPCYEPRVAILSLGSPAVMTFRKQTGSKPFASVLLRPRSLLLFKDRAYQEALHAIEGPDITAEAIHRILINRPIATNDDTNNSLTRTGIRISLTFRKVVKEYACTIKTS